MIRGAQCTSYYFNSIIIMKYIVTLLLLGFTLCSLAQTKIANEQAFKKIKKKGVQLVDVRTDKEYEQNHIKNAIHIDWMNQDKFSEIASHLNKKKPVYVYCKSGNRSSKAAKFLTEQGFQVFDIEGGILNWEASNLPLVTSAEELAQLNFKDFKSIIKYYPLVLVDFYADWCVPCQQLNPIVTAIADKYKGKVKVLKINTDHNKTLVKQMGISGIPKLAIYEYGKDKWSSTGLVDQETIEKELL